MAAAEVKSCGWGLGAWPGRGRGLAGLMLAALLLGGCKSPAAPSTAPVTQAVTISGRTFHLELALTDQARYQGLSDRHQIAADGGMLFVFPEAFRLTFVMRRCYVPIDVIFLDSDGRVDSWHQMKVEPYNRPDSQLHLYRSAWACQFAIELRGGTIPSLHLKVGQKVDLPVEALKQQAQ